MAGYLGLIRYLIFNIQAISWNNLSIQYIGLTLLFKDYIQFNSVQTIRVRILDLYYL